MKFGIQDALTVIANNLENKDPILDLGNLGLTEIPPAVFQLIHLEVLNLGIDFKHPTKLVSNAIRHRPETYLEEGHLKFRKNFITQIPIEIEALQNLKELNLSGNEIRDFSFLEHLSGLRTLNLSYQSTILFDSIKDLSQLENLILNKCDLLDITDLPTFPNLKTLSLEKNFLSKISHLAHLPRLEKLDLAQNEIIEIILNSFHPLKELKLTRNQIEKMEGLHYLSQLEVLNLDQNRLTQLSIKKELPFLKSLILSDNRFEKIPPLHQYPLLEEFQLKRNRIKNINHFPVLAFLKILNLSQNQIQTIAPFPELPLLKILYLSDNRIHKIQGLDQLRNLEGLFINNNQIQTIEGLSHLTNLESLHLSRNEITHIQNVQSLVNLRNLSIGNNNLENVDGLVELPKLFRLNLSNNALKEIKNLPDFPLLNNLSLGHNQLKNITNLSNLPQLKSLSLSHNRIENLDGIKHLKKLENLYLDNNNLKNIEGIENFQDLVHLTISRNWIEDILPLNELSQLEYLNLASNPIKNVEDNLAVLSLQRLYIETPIIKSLEFLKKMPALKELHISSAGSNFIFPNLSNLEVLQISSDSTFDEIRIEQGVKLRDIEFHGANAKKISIANLASLKTICFSNSKEANLSLVNLPALNIIQRIEFKKLEIQNCKQLQEIDFSNCQGTDLSFLEQVDGLLSLKIPSWTISDSSIFKKLHQLVALDCTRTELTEINGLEKLKNLRFLDLKGNKITDIEPLKALKNISSLNLERNQISNLTTIENLINLKILYLSSNPIKVYPELSKHRQLRSFHTDEDKNISLLTPLFPNLLTYQNIIKIIDFRTSISASKLGIESVQVTITHQAELNSLRALPRLKEIILDLNQLDGDLVISGFQWLKKLRINRNFEINTLTIFDNPQLEVITSRSNSIIKFVELFDLVNVTRIEFISSKLEEVKRLENLPNLTHLSLTRNLLNNLPSQLHLPQLEKLNLENNKIENLDFIKPLTSLKSLHLSRNQISDLKPLGALKELDYLRINGNNLNNLVGIDTLIALKRLLVASNQIEDLKPIASLKNITELNLSDNLIQNVTDIEKLYQLNTLDLGNNLIQDITPLKDLVQLTRLLIGENKITDCSSLKDLVSLRNLSIFKNQLTHFPKYLFPLSGLTVLDVRKNPIIDAPFEIVNLRNSIKDARNWYKDLKKGATLNYELKLMVVGNGRIGKTCIVNRLVFDSYNDHEDSTHAIQLLPWQTSITNKNQSKTNIILNIWDFGGQDIYHSTHRLFMQSRALYMVVWDAIMEQQSKTEEIQESQKYSYQNFKLPYWLEYIKSNSKESPILIIQNKSDRDGQKSPPEQKRLNKIYPAEKCLSVSAKTANGFDILESTIDQVISSKMPEIGLATPKSWQLVKEQLLVLAKKQITLNYDAYEKICESVNVYHLSYTSLLSYLHNTGTVFYNKNLFHNKIILDQKWAIAAVYFLFERNQPFYLTYKGIGTFSKVQLQTALKGRNYSYEQQLMIISFMESCEIITEKKKKNRQETTYVAPDLLPDLPNKNITSIGLLNQADSLHLVFKYPILHRFYIQKFIIESSHLASIEQIWRNGIFFQIEDSWALVEASFENYGGQIHIQTYGDKKEYLLYLIQLEFNKIHQYNDKQLKKLVSIDGESYVYLRNLQAVAKIKGATYTVATNNQKIYLKDWAYFIQGIYAQRKETINQIRDLKN